MSIRTETRTQTKAVVRKCCWMLPNRHRELGPMFPTRAGHPSGVSLESACACVCPTGRRPCAHEAFSPSWRLGSLGTSGSIAVRLTQTVLRLTGSAEAMRSRSCRARPHGPMCPPRSTASPTGKTDLGPPRSAGARPEYTCGHAMSSGCGRSCASRADRITWRGACAMCWHAIPASSGEFRSHRMRNC